jgi:hypothetical protein
MKRVTSDDEDDDNGSSISAKRLKISGENEYIPPIRIQLQQPKQQPVEVQSSQLTQAQSTTHTQQSLLNGQIGIPYDFPELSEKGKSIPNTFTYTNLCENIEISELDLSYLRALENKGNFFLKENLILTYSFYRAH